MHVVVRLPLFLALAILAPPAAAQLAARELTELAERYFALDARSAEGRGEQLEILARLDAAQAPSRSTLKRWKASLEKLAAGGRRISERAGEAWFWPEERRGRYFVGGQTRKPSALFVGLHGGGVGSGDAASARDAYSEAARSLGWLGIFPEVLEKTEHGWTDSGSEEFVIDLALAAARSFGIERDRLVLGGHSMGGYGSWVLGAHHADLFAALVPSAGAPSPVFRGGEVVAIQDGVVPCLRNLPMFVFQGSDDAQVPPEPNRFAVRELEAARRRWGGFEDQVYLELDGVGHGYPEGGALALLEKVAGFERQPRPSKLVWQPSLSWKRQFYWLHWEEPVIGALVVAEIDRERSEVVVQVDRDPAGLALLLDDELFDPERELRVVLRSLRLGELEVFRGKPEPSLRAMLETAVHGDRGRARDRWIPLAP